jgi:hypothetical protein
MIRCRPQRDRCAFGAFQHYFSLELAMLEVYGPLAPQSDVR